MEDMSDDVHNGLTPAEEDPVIHRMVTALPTPQPRREFGDLVLSAVWRPHPRWARRVRATLRELIDSGRVWLVVGGLAVGSLVPIAAVAVTISLLAPAVAGGVETLFTELIPVGWTFLWAQVASLFETVLANANALDLHPRAWAMIGITSVVALAGCGWGLNRTMTPRAVRR
jgi:hypothetical protein